MTWIGTGEKFMEYWNDVIVEKSWLVLQEFSKKYSFVLIGGWAIYLYTKANKSKDIDLIMNFEELEKLRKEYALKKNDRLNKYEIKIEEIDIDIYVPFYSRLALPTEEAMKNTEKIQNFSVIKPEYLLVLKQGAEIERQNSAKGLKDRIDILQLLLSENVRLNEYKKLIELFSLQRYKERLFEIIMQFRDLKYLNLNPREYKLKKEELVKELKES